MSVTGCEKEYVRRDRRGETVDLKTMVRARSTSEETLGKGLKGCGGYGSGITSNSLTKVQEAWGVSLKFRLVRETE